MLACQGLVPVVAGIVAGLVGARLLVHTVESMLFAVPATDGATYATAAIGLLLVAAAATVVPALGALRVDPLQTLRAD
jgi:ABC-type antimicrobial peptide transport system permease subunit